MTAPLMPKATAVWLIENTSLTFQQIAAFCQLHSLEVQAIADGETAVGMAGFDPIASGQLTLEEIQRCEADAQGILFLSPPMTPESVLKKKSSRYTPVAKRQDKPDAIAWVLKYYPEMNDGQICQLLSTTRNLIKTVRQKTHWNAANIKPRNPVQIGLCNQADLDTAIHAARPVSPSPAKSDD